MKSLKNLVFSVLAFAGTIGIATAQIQVPKYIATDIINPGLYFNAVAAASAPQFTNFVAGNYAQISPDFTPNVGGVPNTAEFVPITPVRIGNQFGAAPTFGTITLISQQSIVNAAGTATPEVDSNNKIDLNFVPVPDELTASNIFAGVWSLNVSNAFTVTIPTSYSTNLTVTDTRLGQFAWTNLLNCKYLVLWNGKYYGSNQLNIVKLRLNAFRLDPF